MLERIIRKAIREEFAEHDRMMYEALGLVSKDSGGGVGLKPRARKVIVAGKD